MSEEEFKKIMLDFSDVNPNCPESVRKYGERCTLAGEIYYALKRCKLVGEISYGMKGKKRKLRD